MLADELDFVVGVDPHRDSHALGVVEVRSGVVVFEASVAADGGGYVEALRVAEQHAPGRRAFAIEGTGSFGAGLTRFLAAVASRCSKWAGCGESGSRAARPMPSTRSGPLAACSPGNGLHCRAAAGSVRRYGR